MAGVVVGIDDLEPIAEVTETSRFEVRVDEVDRQGRLCRKATGVQLEAFLHRAGGVADERWTQTETALEAETERAAGAEQANATAIATEATARAQAVTTLQNNIDAEEVARQVAEAGLQGAINAEAQTRAQAVTTLQTNITTEATTRGNADVVAIAYADATHILALTKGDGDTLTQALPVAGNDADGFMPKEAHTQLLQNTANIASLSANAFRALGTIQQKTPDVTPTLLNAFVADLGLSPKLNYSIKDLDNLTWLCNDITTDSANPAWIQWGDTPIDPATNETLGVVKGDETTAGKVFVEVDGSLSLIGWDALNAKVAANTGAITAEAERAETAEQDIKDILPTKAEVVGVLTDNPGVITPPAASAATVWDVLQACRDNLKALDTIQLTDAGADPALPSTNPSTIPQLLQQTRNTLKSVVSGITAYFPDNTLTTENGGLGLDVSQVFTPENAGKLLIIGDDGKISSEDSIYLNDSTEEQNTGLKWIDGKSRYQKSFSGTFASSNSYQTYQTLNIPHGISAFGGLRAMMGSFYSVSGQFYLPLEFFISSDSAVDIRIDATNIVVHHRFNFSGDVRYQILLEYTKAS